MGIDLRDVEQPIGTLSGGERQCVAIARAVYFGARVLILDEPTAALGVRQSGVVLKYIAKARDRGLGVIFITHNPHHAYPVGDRFMILRRGRSMGNFPKAEMTLDELVQMMAGGTELEALSHELARRDARLRGRQEHGGRGQRDAQLDERGVEGRAVRPAASTDDARQRRGPRSSGVAVVGFGWMGQVHSRAWARLLHHYPDAPLRPRLVAVADTDADAPERGPGQPTGSSRHAREQDRAARARRRRRGERVRPELRAPRDRQRRGRRPAGTCGSRSRPAAPRTDTAADRRGRAQGRGAVGGGLQLPQRPGGRSSRGGWSPPGASATVETVDVSMLADYSAHPDQALSWRFDPELRRDRRARRPGQPRLRPRAVRGRRRRAGRVAELVADQATFIPERPIVSGGRVALRTGRRRSSRAGRQRGPRVRPAEVRLRGTRSARRRRASRWGSSAATPSRSAGRRARSPWDFRRMGELRICLDQDYQDADLGDPPGPARRRRAGGVPARIRRRDELRRPQGRGVPPPGGEHQHRRAARRRRSTTPSWRRSWWTPMVTVLRGEAMGDDVSQWRREQVRVGVIGAGAMGASHVETLARWVPGAGSSQRLRPRPGPGQGGRRGRRRATPPSSAERGDPGRRRRRRRRRRARPAARGAGSRLPGGRQADPAARSRWRPRPDGLATRRGRRGRRRAAALDAGLHAALRPGVQRAPRRRARRRDRPPRAPPTACTATRTPTRATPRRACW